MAARIRDFDWSGTPLGPVASWPERLTHAVELALAIPQPAWVCWGPDLRPIYNDDYRVILGAKHPGALGRPLAEVWAEAADVLAPAIEAVRAGASWHVVDAEYELSGRDAEPTRAWFSATWTPVRGDDGAVAGVFCVATETTERVRAERALRASEARHAFLLRLSDAVRPLTDPTAIQQTAARLLAEHLGVARVAYGEVDGEEIVVAGEAPADGDPPASERYRLADFGEQLIADLRAGEPMVVADAATDERLGPNERAAYAARGIGALIGTPLVKEGRFVAALLAYDPARRGWTDDELSLIVETAERTWVAGERARAQNALRESEERFRLAMEIETVGVVFLTLDGRVTDASDAFLRMSGLNRADVRAGRVHWRDFTPAGWAPATRSVIARVAAGARAIPYEKEYVRRNGMRWWGLVAPKLLPGGTIVEFVLDVTLRKRTQEALRESEERYRTLVQNLPDYAIYLLDPHCIITEWTEGAERVMGYTALEAIDRHVSMFYPPEDVATGAVEAEFREAAIAGRAEREGWRVREGGERFWANEIATAIRDDDGHLLGFTKINRDLTERRLAEEALRQGEERYRAIVEEATDYAIFTTDEESRIDTWPPGAQAVFGWTAEEAIGQPLEITFTPEDRAAGEPEKEFNTARETGVSPNVRWHLRKGGDRVFIEGVARARRGADGAFLGVLKIGQDVTERRTAERARQEEEARIREELEGRATQAMVELRGLSRRLLTVQEEERRRLALELHDEIGQMLTGLGFQLGAGDATDRERLAEAKRIVGELTTQVRQLSMDLRPAALDAYGLLPALRWHLERFQQQTGILIDLRQEGTDRRFPLPVEIAAYRIVQEALTNVARHAESTAAIVHLFADEAVLTLSVRDFGRGFAVDAAASGSGSGLAGMRERAELLGGTLVVDTGPGEGVVVTAELPIESIESETDQEARA